MKESKRPREFVLISRYGGRRRQVVIGERPEGQVLTSVIAKMNMDCGGTVDDAALMSLAPQY